MQNPVFRSIVDLKVYNLPKGDGHNAVSATSDDILLGSYAGLIGIKTGFTNAAAHTLLFEAVRNGRTLIGVVLGSPATSPFTGFQDAANDPQLGLRPQTVRLRRGLRPQTVRLDTPQRIRHASHRSRPCSSAVSPMITKAFFLA